MGNWREVTRCKNCKKVYTRGVSLICKKCGEQLAKESVLAKMVGGCRSVMLTSGAEKVVAKRTLRGWKFKDETNTNNNADLTLMSCDNCLYHNNHISRCGMCEHHSAWKPKED